MGISRATWYRLLCPPATTVEPIPQRDRVQPATLTADERAQIQAYLSDELYIELSVSQVFVRLFYLVVFVASESSWHRVARARQLSGDRRAQARHKSTAIPVLCAERPNQVWSWDITDLRSIDRGRSFKLYTMLDVFSRYVVGWRLEPAEDADLAKEMFTEALTRHDADLEVLHADRGSAMTSDAMKHALADRHIIQSHSRPRVSNDNPFSESQFKTMKYTLDYPREFRDIDHARAWVTGFINAYNTEHRHSGIGHYTPESVHHDTWTVDQRRRQRLLTRSWRKNPHRYHRRPRAQSVHDKSWINKPNEHQPAN